ncbi:MAG: DNA polymerase [Candidatus Binatia bacterium]|nr:MAG: DNA polymerase [Candidatus Binatia bacterium]
MTFVTPGQRGPEEWRWWLALRMVPGVGPVVYQALLRAFHEPRTILEADRDALECAGLRPEVAQAVRSFNRWRDVERDLDRLRRAGAVLVTWNDVHYPALLRQIHDPPPFLYLLGELHPADNLSVAVVGSRHPTSYGLRMAREITVGLVQFGVTVVSGLARGIDAAAHWAAVKEGGRTIAVLGSGVDVIYPPEHKALAQRMITRGAIVSELPMGAQPDAENFPARNRIISGMSRGTIVVEAAEKSGSLITAHVAAEQGREVFAVPGPVGERSRGTHRLIRNGATLTESARDVIEELAPQLLQRAASPAPQQRELPLEAAPIIALLRGHPLHVDELIARTGQPATQVLTTLLDLELKGIVQQLPGKCFALAENVSG